MIDQLSLCVDPIGVGDLVAMFPTDADSDAGTGHQLQPVSPASGCHPADGRGAHGGGGEHRTVRSCLSRGIAAVQPGRQRSLWWS
jgi:hypothetical protein